jgi:hypothetical protein
VSVGLFDRYWWGDSEPPTPGPTQTVPTGGAMAIARTSWPEIFVEGFIPPRMRAVLMHRSTSAIKDVGPLDGSMQRRWQDVLNDAGTASLVIPNEDPQSTAVNIGDVIRMEDDGWATFSWLVKEIERVQVARGEEAEQVTTISGPGLLAILGEAIIYPWGGPDVQPHSDDRVFSWAAPDAFDWFWPGVNEIVRFGDAGTTMGADGNHIGWSTQDGKPVPLSIADGGDWPDDDAQWIWSQNGGTVDWAEPGDVYFHRRIDVPEGVTNLDMFLAADNGAWLYFDGRYVGFSEFGADDTVALPFSTPVTPGEHLIAVKGENAPADGPTNPAGILFTCYPSDGEEITGGPLVHSDWRWTCVAYPPPGTTPGMSPGIVMWHSILEAQLRGCLGGLRLSFNDEFDSDGNPWPIPASISTKVGTDLLTFFREICETYADMWIEPGNLMLHAWVKGMRGSAKPHVRLYPVTDPNDPWSGNAAGITYTKVD